LNTVYLSVSPHCKPNRKDNTVSEAAQEGRKYERWKHFLDSFV